MEDSEQAQVTSGVVSPKPRPMSNPGLGGPDTTCQLLIQPSEVRDKDEWSSSRSLDRDMPRNNNRSPAMAVRCGWGSGGGGASVVAVFLASAKGS